MTSTHCVKALQLKRMSSVTDCTDYETVLVVSDRSECCSSLGPAAAKVCLGDNTDLGDEQVCRLV